MVKLDQIRPSAISLKKSDIAEGVKSRSSLATYEFLSNFLSSSLDSWAKIMNILSGDDFLKTIFSASKVEKSVFSVWLPIWYVRAEKKIDPDVRKNKNISSEKE